MSLSALFVDASVASGCGKFVSMSPEYVVLDLLSCLETNAAKREKRISRLLFVAKHFISELSEKTRARISTVLTALANSTEEEPEVEEDIGRLLNESQIMLNMLRDDRKAPIVFPKLDPYEGTYTPPYAKVLHEHCRAILNADGHLYDLFTAVAVVAFADLLLASRKGSPLRQQLMSSSKLLFKGGAAIGKFLFIANKRVWEGLSAEDREYVFTSFIAGGDNDTALHFERVRGFTELQINGEIERIARDFQKHLAAVIAKYRVDKLTNSERVAGTVVKYDGHEFTFSARDARSYRIEPKNDRQCQLVHQGQRGQIFTSAGLNEILYPEVGLVRFHLVRAKIGYRAGLDGSDVVSVNCYGECLDISIMCIDSACRVTPPTYQQVQFADFLGQMGQTCKIAGCHPKILRMCTQQANMSDIVRQCAELEQKLAKQNKQNVALLKRLASQKPNQPVFHHWMMLLVVGFVLGFSVNRERFLMMTILVLGAMYCLHCAPPRSNARPHVTRHACTQQHTGSPTGRPVQGVNQAQAALKQYNEILVEANVQALIRY